MFDPMSTPLVISCADVLLPVLTKMINLSLNSGEFADDSKCGLINPILKKPGARSIQPKFPEISVQNSMDRFGPTGKVSKKRVHLLRWTTFPGRTGWNFG